MWRFFVGGIVFALVIVVVIVLIQGQSKKSNELCIAGFQVGPSAAKRGFTALSNKVGWMDPSPAGAFVARGGGSTPMPQPGAPWRSVMTGFKPMKSGYTPKSKFHPTSVAGPGVTQVLPSFPNQPATTTQMVGSNTASLVGSTAYDTTATNTFNRELIGINSTRAMGDYASLGNGPVSDSLITWQAGYGDLSNNPVIANPLVKIANKIPNKGINVFDH
jgi:hypothetical protein